MICRTSFSWLSIFAALLLAGCNDKLENQRVTLDKFVEKNRFGSGSDAWLTKYNALGDWERVALVFGFMDDREFWTILPSYI